MKKLKNAMPIIIGVAFLYGVMACLHITCPIKFLTGISCPGCGMSRACLSAVQMDFEKAFYYHPLFPLPFIGAAVYVFGDNLSEKTVNRLIFLGAVLLTVVYIIRLTGPANPIVCADIKEGFIYKVISAMTHPRR